MLIFALLFLSSARIFTLEPSEVSSFTQKHSDKFQTIYFCDFSMDPCVFFTNTTTPYLNRVNGKVAKVNVASQEDASHLEEFEIKDFPYIIYIKPHSKFKQYRGSLEPIEIFSTLDRIQKGLVEYNNIESVYNDLENKLYSDGLVLLYKQKEIDEFIEELLPFFPIAECKFELGEEFNCGNECVVVFRPNILQDKGKISYSVVKGKEKEDRIVGEYYKGLIWLTPNNHVWLSKEKPLLTLYGKISGKSEPEHTRYVASRYFRVVKHYFEEFTVAIAKIEDFQWILADIGLGKHKSLLMFDNTEDMFYEFDLISSNYSVNTEKIRNFIENYKSNKLTPYIISEPVPESPFENNIKILVGSTVKSELASINSDTVLLVYSLFYEELQSLIYFFEQMASRLNELKFMKLEAHRNYVPPELITEYPAAFYLRPGYQPQPIKIDLEDPEKTLKIIAMYYRSSHDL
jgi:hypothetical protein